MSALAEALVAAQRATLTAMAKAHVSYLDGEPAVKDSFHELLNSIGCTDQVEQEQLWAAWETLRSAGAPPPVGQPTTSAPKGPEPATDAQLALIAKLVKEKNVTGPDLPITKGQAHEVIDSLKAGTYDAAKWTVPF